MAFKDQTSSFFDELSSIVDEQKRVKEEGLDAQGGGKPFSSMLTQDEEPQTQYNPADVEVEPEVVTRRG